MSTLPGFNEPFHSYYDKFSVHVDDISIPEHFDRFVPDNQDDYNCVMVVSPSVTKGAKKWTRNGEWITIGIYRDEGRDTAQRPARSGLSWSRSGLTTTIVDPDGHKLRSGERVNVWNINVPSIEDVEIQVVDDYSFSFRGVVIGATAGSGASYQPNFETNFYETYRVFRLLPSFKLVEFSLIQQLFNDTAPEIAATRRTIYNITTSTEDKVPTGKNASINYELPSRSVPTTEKLKLRRRFGQVYDEAGDPLKLSYLPNGYATPTNNVDSATKNPQVFWNHPRVLEGTTADDSRVYAYDYYGLDLNDLSRGPYHSDQIVTRDTTVSSSIGNIKVKLNNVEDPVYQSTVNDEYGNLAIGIQTNNTLVVRKQILPLSLDYFNKPTKKPL